MPTQVTPTGLRETHGSVYVTETPDGLIVPWKPLSLGDYLEYDYQIKAGLIDRSVLENEIFRKCVTDPILIRNIDKQKAGTITVVATSIMANSGIDDVATFNRLFDQSRALARQPVHQLVGLICRAFPGYTPDDIYEMDFQKMVFRLAQAEDKLLTLGMLTEPIDIFVEGEEEESPQPVQKKPPAPKKDYKIDTKKMKESYDKQQGPKSKKLNLSSQLEKEELDLGSTKEGEQFVVDSSLMLTGMEVGDENDARSMKKSAETIYGDYLKQIPTLKKGDKIKIKPVEQRVEEYKEMVKKRKQDYVNKAKKKKAGQNK